MSAGNVTTARPMGLHTERRAWERLQSPPHEDARHHLGTLFADDPGRGDCLTIEVVGDWLFANAVRPAGGFS